MFLQEQKLISIIVPVYNEEKNIPLLYTEIIKVWREFCDKYDYEIIFVDDGSKDNSLNIVKKIGCNDNRIKYIEFSCNFGKEMATTAGINMCQGDACIILDADLQHPVECIPEFLAKWKAGAEVVIGVRNKNKTGGILRKVCSYLFYKIINSISGTPIVTRATDYRLLNRVVIGEFNRFTEKNRMTRGLIDWLGFKSDFVYFDAPERKESEARYGYLKLTKLAISTFVSHSLLPLKLAGYLGIFITFFSGLFGLLILITQYIYESWSLGFSGPAQLAVLIVFLIGIVLSCLGLVALYIGSIHTEVINRPLYVVRSKKL